MDERHWDRLYIGGTWRQSHGSEKQHVENPANGKSIGSVPLATVRDAEDAVAAARKAFDEGPWPRMAVNERLEVMRNMSTIMRRRRDELFDLDTYEVGRAQATSGTFIDVPIDRWDDLIDRVVPAFDFSVPINPNFNGNVVGQGIVLREPIGVVTAISPYNAPWMLAMFKLGPALAAGCTLVTMPSPLTPMTSFVFAEIAEEAGVPEGVVNVLSGSPDVGAFVTADSRVDMVSFTGSDTVGSLILAQAAPSIKKVVLELGGKSANILCEDANLDRASIDILRNFTSNAGQGCGLMTRTIVHESIHDELVDRLIKLAANVKVGDPVDPTVTMGPLISAAQRDKVEAMVDAAVAEGARVVAGGKRPLGLDGGYFYEPTLLVDVKNSMAIAQDEVFGPVMTVIPFSTDEEAISIANDSRYGLAGGVYTENIARAYSIAQQMRTGGVAINGGSGRINPHGAFGGYKKSGLGREWGAWGFEEYLEHKMIHWQAGR